METGELRHALAQVLAGEAAHDLATAVQTLIARYRAPGAASTPILQRPVDILAYAAYRMPATYAAARAVLAQAAQTVRDLRPASLLDVGGGTGAATWAATEVFPGIEQVTVLDQVAGALDLGARLGAYRPVLAAARRQAWNWRDPASGSAAQTLPAADLLTISYVLAELPEPGQAALLDAAALAARTVVAVIEPGTPAGYRRVLAARQRLTGAGWQVVAPCPHEQPCPLRGQDWCHFSVRVNRSALHRRVKHGDLGYEDEKFSYLVAVQDPAPAPVAWSRVLRRPGQRKSLVLLRLCRPDGAAADETVSQRQGERYRAAREVVWGDAWTPGAS